MKIPVLSFGDKVTGAATSPGVCHQMDSVNFSLLWTVLVTQSCPTLCDPTDCSPPGFSVHGILQVKILEWIAIPFSRGTS